jgi:hypothetical protein
MAELADAAVCQASSCTPERSREGQAHEANGLVLLKANGLVLLKANRPGGGYAPRPLFALYLRNILRPAGSSVYGSFGRPGARLIIQRRLSCPSRTPATRTRK